MSPGPFPCCLLTGIILSMFDPFPVSYTKLPETLEIYSFIDEVMISRIKFYNHTQEELPTLKIEYAVLSEENKGL